MKPQNSKANVKKFLLALYSALKGSVKNSEV